MIQIDIHIPRPLSTLALVGAFCLGMYWGGGYMADATGGSGAVQAQTVRTAENDVKRLREEQDVLSRREQILRGELEALLVEERRTRNPDTLAQLRSTREELIALIQDQKQAEREILRSLHQIWEAQGYAMQLSGTGEGSIKLIWPVEPHLGISAHFDDDGYERRFGMPHHAIDIPVAQGSVVKAAADGTVVKVSDNGMGFNSLIIRHENGFATLYGHVSAFLVEEGQRVSAGDPVALSGGRPGTPGAGRMTTGAHLHLELIKDGVQTDPMPYIDN